MRSRRWQVVSASAVVLAVAGCSTAGSGDVRTSGMTARIFVTATASGIGVAADLVAGGTTSVALPPGESLVARADGQAVTLQETSTQGLHSYSATIPAPATPGAVVQVDLLRGADAAASSSVALPGPVGLRAPRAAAVVSRAQDLPVQIAPGTGSIRLDWNGACVGTGEVRFEEAQPVVVPAGTLTRSGATTGGAPVPDRCAVALTVTRVLEGRLASSYQGGLIESTRSESVVVRSVP